MFPLFLVVADIIAGGQVGDERLVQSLVCMILNVLHSRILEVQIRGANEFSLLKLGTGGVYESAV